jgi:HTH-type transcriptional regulator, competence development regulator
MNFGDRVRELRKAKGLTLRDAAKPAGMDFTYLSKLETGKLTYTPSSDVIRALAKVLGADPLELLRLADKLPPELGLVSAVPAARRFMNRAGELANPEDWDALLDLLERRHEERSQRRERGEQ